MATNCKLIFGYKDHTNEWITTDVYYRHYDGYTEAIIPLLKEHKADITTMNESAEYDGHKWEKLDNIMEGVTRPDYLYYVDMSDLGEIKCTALCDDLEFWRMYNISNYRVEQVFTL